MTTMYTLLHTALAVEFQAIIKYYGMLCLFCLPVSLAAIIFIYRTRPEIIKKMDAAVDRLFGDEPEMKPKAKQNPPPATTMKDAEENAEEYGIPLLTLFVGDKYKCVMSAKNRKDIGGTNFAWAVSDPFVGQIKGLGGIFTALHAGTACIESEVGRKPIYFVNVKPRNTDWFAAQVISDVIDGVDIESIKVRNIKDKIIDLDNLEQTIDYKLPQGALSYEYGRDGAIRRALFGLQDSPENREDISAKIAEYMSPVESDTITSTGAQFWLHKNYAEDEYVDFLAFMMKARSGKLYFGIGECWRYGASEDEVAENPLMAIRSFRKLLEAADCPAAIGADLSDEPSKEEIAGRQEIQEANNAGAPQEEPHYEIRDEASTNLDAMEGPVGTTPEEPEEEQNDSNEGGSDYSIDEYPDIENDGLEISEQERLEIESLREDIGL